MRRTAKRDRPPAIVVLLIVIAGANIVCLLTLHTRLTQYEENGGTTRSIGFTTAARKLLHISRRRHAHWPPRQLFIWGDDATLQAPPIPPSRRLEWEEYPPPYRVVEYQMGYHTDREQRFIDRELFIVGEADDEWFQKHVWAAGSGLEPLRSWQTTSFPTCNDVHGAGGLQPESWKERQNIRLLAEGGRNWVFSLWTGTGGAEKNVIWKMHDYDGEPFPPGRDGGALDPAFTGRGDRFLGHKSLRRVAMDALIMERTTSCPSTLPVYGHCGLNLFTEPSHSGPLKKDQLGEVLTPQQRLRYAIQVAGALAAIENIDGDGIPSYVDRDLANRQFLYIASTDTIKLNDFNIGTFISRNQTTGKAEPNFVDDMGMESEVWRSPEEFRTMAATPRKSLPLTSKSVVYSMCHVLQRILTGENVYAHDLTDQDALAGKRNPLPSVVAESVDPIIVGYRETLDSCFAFEPEERASAMEVLVALRKLQVVATRAGNN